MFGVDISKYQGEINFRELAGEVDFVIIRLGFRGYGDGRLHYDHKCEEYINACNNHNIPWGAYWFSQAINNSEAREEAEAAIKMVKGKNPTFPIYIDTEWANNKHNGRADMIPSDIRSDVVYNFCKRIEELGFYAGYYCSTSFLSYQLDASRLKRFDLWLADWRGIVPTIANKYGMHQYTNNGYVKGINTRVDLNRAYYNYPEIIRNNHLNDYQEKDLFYSFKAEGLTKSQTTELVNAAERLGIASYSTEVIK